MYEFIYALYVYICFFFVFIVINTIFKYYCLTSTGEKNTFKLSIIFKRETII